MPSPCTLPSPVSPATYLPYAHQKKWGMMPFENKKFGVGYLDVIKITLGIFRNKTIRMSFLKKIFLGNF